MLFKSRAHWCTSRPNVCIVNENERKEQKKEKQQQQQTSKNEAGDGTEIRAEKIAYNADIPLSSQFIAY